MGIAMDLFRVLHHWLVPHSSNNHRAKALHHDALLVYVLLLGIFNLGIRFFHGQAPDVLGFATDIRVEQLLADTNDRRQAAGLGTLTLNSVLSQAAAAKAADMLTNDYWAHNSPQGKTPWDFINGAGYKYTLAGENLAKNFQTSDGVVDAWMASPSHRDNLLKSGYKDVGFAVVNGKLNGEDTTLVVQMFGASSAPLAQIPQVHAEAPATAPVAKVAPATVVPEEPVPVVTTAPAVPEPSSVPVPPVPSAAPVPAIMPALSQVQTMPLVNISSLSRNVVYAFVGVLMGVLLVDAYVVSRRQIVRLSGHNLAHVLFLASIIGAGLFITRGSLL